MNKRNNNFILFSRITSTLLIAVITVQISFKVVWQHAHVLPDGTMLVHAHPYNKTTDSAPFKKHNHSQSEFTLLQNLEILFPISMLALVLILTPRSFKWNVPEFRVVEYQIRIRCGRSPPF